MICKIGVLTLSIVIWFEDIEALSHAARTDCMTNSHDIIHCFLKNTFGLLTC